MRIFQELFIMTFFVFLFFSLGEFIAKGTCQSYFGRRAFRFVTSNAYQKKAREKTLSQNFCRGIFLKKGPQKTRGQERRYQFTFSMDNL